MTRWCSLYLPYGADGAAEALAAALKTALTTLGYQAYDPFGLLPGKAYPQAVRLFIQPPRGAWLRVIGEPDLALLAPLSRFAPVLWVELDGADARIDACADGQPALPENAFPAHADCIRRARLQSAASGGAALGGVALDALPSDVQALAEKVDLKQAGALFARLSGSLAAKAGGDEAARDLLRQPDWQSAGGAQIAAVMDCLGIANWREPDFVTLRDAYTLHLRRRRAPKATLYPGDAEALAAVPDALDYTPIYAGKN